MISLNPGPFLAGGRLEKTQPRLIKHQGEKSRVGDKRKRWSWQQEKAKPAKCTPEKGRGPPGRGGMEGAASPGTLCLRRNSPPRARCPPGIPASGMLRPIASQAACRSAGDSDPSLSGILMPAIQAKRPPKNPGPFSPVSLLAPALPGPALSLARSLGLCSCFGHSGTRM